MTMPNRLQPVAAKQEPNRKIVKLFSTLNKHKYLYLIMFPSVLWYFIYKYLPMYGVIIGFKDFNFMKGIWGSPWVGLKHFKFLFSFPDFYRIVTNTIIINVYELLFAFPAAIILALMLNEMKSILFKRSIQTVVYFPHFLSWVIFGGVIIHLLGPGEGLVNQIRQLFDLPTIHYMVDSNYFRPIVIISLILKETGWAAIIYLAALAGIDPEQYEAAIIDGANRFHKIIYVTIPGIRNTIIILLILKVGSMMDFGFEQIYVLYSPAVYDVGDILPTYIYRMGLLDAKFSLTAAIGLFQSAIGFFLIWGTNLLAKKYSDVTIW
jgi:putative aldouronate transport system permease protein